MSVETGTDIGIPLCTGVPCKLQVSAQYCTVADAGCVHIEPREALIAADEVSHPEQHLFLHIKDGSCVHTWD